VQFILFWPHEQVTLISSLQQTIRGQLVNRSFFIQTPLFVLGQLAQFREYLRSGITRVQGLGQHSVNQHIAFPPLAPAPCHCRLLPTLAVLPIRACKFIANLSSGDEPTRPYADTFAPRIDDAATPVILHQPVQHSTHALVQKLQETVAAIIRHIQISISYKNWHPSPFTIYTILEKYRQYGPEDVQVKAGTSPACPNR